MDEVEPGDVRSNADLTQAAGSGLRWITYARIAIEVTLLAGMVVLARLIPPAAFGMFAVVLIIQELALSLPMEGIGSALVQRRSIGREHLQAGLSLSLCAGVALAALTLVSAHLVVDPVFGPETASLVVLATPWFLIGAVFSLPTAVLRRRLEFARLSLVELTMTSTRAAASIALALAGLDATALVLGNLVGMAAALVLALAFAPVPLPRWHRRAVRDLLPYGGPAALACIAWTGFRNGDYAIIGARLGTTQAGFYYRAYQLAVEYQKKISAVMAQMAFPVLARTAGPEAMFELRRRMVRLLSVVLFPLLALLALLAPVVVPWLFGAAWAPAVVPTQILAAGGAATLTIDAVGSALQAAGRASAMLGFGVAHFVVYAAVVVAVSGHGLAAVSAGAAVVHAAFLVVAYQLLLRGQEQRALRVLWDDLSAALVGCAALVAVAWPAQWALRGAGAGALVTVALVGAAGAAAYLAALRAGFPAAWRDLAAALRRVLPGRLTRRMTRVSRASAV
jgi:PST family polysaccharide transporter